MALVQKVRVASILKWVTSNFVETRLKSSKFSFWPNWSVYIAPNPRFYGTENSERTEKSEIVVGISNEIVVRTSNVDGDKSIRISRDVKKQAQHALLEYFYSTRSLQFMDAEYISKNAPCFLEKLLKKIDIGADVGRSVSRFLRYHPINEFEPFFESLGLEPSEFTPLLPRDLIFLSDDELLLENYHVLCHYGIPHNKIGKIYRQAIQVFTYDFGVLASKLQAYEELGFSRSFMCKVFVCSPTLLIGNVNMDFPKVLELLRSMGMEISWVDEHLSEQNSYNWSIMLEVLSLFSVEGYGKKELGGLISQYPGLLFESSGDRTLTLIGFLIKFGLSMNEICPNFQQFPQIEVGKFILNLRNCFHLLHEIEMTGYEIGKIIRSHFPLLGTCSLKKTNSLLANLNVGKKRLCEFIQENPQELKKWVLGTKVEPLPREDHQSKSMKTRFLLDLGYVESSNKLNEALKVFRGKGTEIQERFDCLVKAGLDRKDVSEMVIVSPQILNQSTGVLETKIDFLVNELGYPISTLVAFPSYLSYTIERVRLRLSMHNWLKDQGKINSPLSLSTVIACSDKYFLRHYVKRHPRGPQVWEDLKKKIYSG